MSVIGVLLAMVAPFVAMVVLGGWTVPLIMGIMRNRRERNGGGLIALGAVWGACALAGIVYLGVQLVGLQGRYTPTTFDTATYQGETGTVIVPWRGACALSLWPQSGEQMLQIESETGTLTVPAGSHTLRSWALKATDERGREWEASGQPGYDGQDSRSTLNVSAGQAVELNVGPPLTARVVVDSSGSTDTELALDFALTDAGGANYTVSGGGDEPRFEVVNSAGEVVWSGSFAYG